MEKLSNDSELTSWVKLEPNLERDDLESQLFSVEARVDECLNQFQSRVREHDVELEAKAAEYLRLILELFPEGKRVELDERQKVRLEFVEKLVRKIRFVALNQVPLITRKFSELLIEEVESATPAEQMKQFDLMEQLDLEFKAREVKLKEELDKRFQECAKDLESKLEKQLEDQRQNFKEREKHYEELEKQLEQVKKNQNKLFAKTVRSHHVDAAPPTKRPTSSPAKDDQRTYVVHGQPGQSVPESHLQRQTIASHSAAGLVQRPAPISDADNLFSPCRGLVSKPSLSSGVGVFSPPSAHQQPEFTATSSMPDRKQAQQQLRRHTQFRQLLRDIEEDQRRSRELIASSRTELDSFLPSRIIQEAFNKLFMIVSFFLS